MAACRWLRRLPSQPLIWWRRASMSRPQTSWRSPLDFIWLSRIVFLVSFFQSVFPPAAIVERSSACTCDYCSCESGCAYHDITDFVTNTLMKVQHVAVSENSVHNSCVPRTVIWTLSANVTESAAWIEGYTSLVSTPNVL